MLAKIKLVFTQETFIHLTLPYLRGLRHPQVPSSAQTIRWAQCASL